MLACSLPCPGVRKHARKTHMAWLKAIDETAGARDRMHESKPSTYCTMELVDADEAEAENLEPSPTLLPTPMPCMTDIPALSLRVPAEPRGEAMPALEGHARPMPEANAAMSHAMAAAAAAALVNAAPPPPLAWLFSQHMAHALAHGGPLPTPASLLAQAAAYEHNQAARTDLPVGLAAHAHAPSGGFPPSAEAPRLPAMPPAWPHSWAAAHEAMNGAMLSGGFPPPSTSFGVTVPTAGMPPSPLAPLPPPVNWDDLDDLFARATDDADYDAPPPSRPAPSDEDGVDRDVPGDPLCLSPPMVSAMAAVRVDGHLSPFELDKRPNGSSSSPQTTMAGGLSGLSPNAQPPEKLLHPPAAPPKPADADNFDETLTLKEADYSAFIETLLAPDPAPIQVATVAV